MKTYVINDFKVGEIVYLKSDFKQPMVIRGIDTNGNMIRCNWRDNKKTMNEVFPPEVLCKESDKPPLRSASIISIGS